VHEAIDRLTAFLAGHRRVLVLTGAGCSTDSGIPDYRDANGEWKHAQPVRYQQFVSDEATRRRYWARSAVGWRRIVEARPNAAHHALAALEASGVVHGLITQNVDGLHSRAGSRRVIDLHGRLDTVRCLACGALTDRAAFQARLLACNPHLGAAVPEAIAPDGDAAVAIDYDATRVPACVACGGLLKPHVVFFGEGVPPARVAEAFALLDAADALLVVGSSLMVYSGYRFAQAAARAGKPIAAVNLGRTRADDHIALKVALPCGEALAAAVRAGGDRNSTMFTESHRRKGGREEKSIF
jgi:NAD-dependent SIR2 family protein deacetylase